MRVVPCGLPDLAVALVFLEFVELLLPADTDLRVYILRESTNEHTAHKYLCLFRLRLRVRRLRCLLLLRLFHDLLRLRLFRDLLDGPRRLSPPSLLLDRW